MKVAVSITLPYYLLSNTQVNDSQKINADFAALATAISNLSGSVSAISGAVSALSGMLSSIKTATNLASGWYRIATAPATANVGAFTVVHKGHSKNSVIKFSVAQALGSTEPVVNIHNYDVSTN
jgi:hypothetical protein